MKKYKLIKKYPGSPALDVIIEFCDRRHAWKMYKSDPDLVLGSINYVYPEKYPEFWEEIVEKEYEILSFRFNKDSAYPGNIWDVDHRGLFGVVGDMHWCSLKSMLDFNNNKEIHSIKRLSDGEIFTVGDKINFISLVQYKDWKINEIHFGFKDNERIYFDLSKNGDTYQGLSLEKAEKAKQPLFRTEDGVDVFHGDIYYRVTNTSKDVFSKPLKCDASEFNGYPNNKYPKTQIKYKCLKAAEEYILMNKPCLSLYDLRNIQLTYDDKLAIKQLVKSKL